MNLKAAYMALIMGCISFCALAQPPYPSQNGTFQVNEKSGCPTLPVTLTIVSGTCSLTDPCNIDWGDGSAVEALTSNIKSHNYTSSGRFRLQLLVGTSATDEIEINVFTDTPPAFDLYTCNGNQISVGITDTNLNYNEYVIDYNDGSPLDVVGKGARRSHTYSSGVQTVTVRGRNSDGLDNCSAASKQITALASLAKPTINLLQVLTPESIQLDFSTQPNVLYRLEIAVNNASTFQIYKTLYNVSSELIGNLKTDDNYYCFRLVPFDPCSNSSVSANSSDIICSSNFDLSVQNNSNNLTWITSAAGVTDFTLNRTTETGSLGRNVSGSPFQDTEIFCGTEYCYQLITNYTTNGSRSISLEKCGTAISTDIPETVQNITAIVGDPGVNLQWPAITNYTPEEFTIYRSREGSILNIFSTTTDFQINDASYSTENATCYIISYIDVCGNTSLNSAEACPVKLTGAVQQDNAIALTWTAYTGWSSGVNDYIVEKYSVDGQLLQTFSAGTNLTLLDESQDDLVNQSYRYVVKANAVEPGLPQAVSNAVVITKSSNIFYPTAFTPNGDNLNDLFNVFGQYIVTFQMKIFNRWGELVYTANALEQGWDGTFRNNPMPEGTYTFVADITDRAGRSFKKSGSVLLLRKR